MQAVIVDCYDPERLAEFWAAVLGWRITVRGEPEWGIEPQAGSRDDSVVPDMLFLRVPDPTPGKNRLHIDLRPDDEAGGQEAEIARLEGLGATRADIGQGDDVSWQVMHDPEGNEFCVLAAYSPELRALWRIQYEAFQRLD
jgi:hypothetical protein